MGTIVERPRKGGSIGYTAQIRVQHGGKKHTEAQTFDRRQAAVAWLKKRELAQPGALDAAAQKDPRFSEVIDQYTEESIKKIGRTKAQVLKKICTMPIGEMSCSEIKSQDIVQFAKSIDAQPQTVGNYVSHLASVFTIARPAWGYPLDVQAMDDARKVLGKLGAAAKSNRRDRRPTLEELDQLLDLFQGARQQRGGRIPMAAITAFSIFSTRRIEETCTIRWEDLDENASRVLARDLKHPGQKQGNDVWCDLPAEALRIIQAQPRRENGPIFPYNSKSVSAAFTRACHVLAIDDLHLHDMRHEGTSRLFEMGLSIPHVAAVTGHRSWASLKRYTHLRHTGDRFADWKWVDVVCAVAT